MFLGAHVSSAGGFENSIKNGEKLGVNCIQAMFSAPMRWSMDEIDESGLEAFAEEAKNSEVKKLLLHGIYLINLARKEKQKFHLSKVSLRTHLTATAKLQKLLREKAPDFEVLGLTFHPGSAIDLEPKEGIERIVEGLDWVIEKVDEGMILLETSAGSGNVMGDTFEELASMREGSKFKDRIGYVVDTQHTYVSGYDWVNDLDGVVEQMDRILGLDLIKAIHLNDSMKEFNSHKDRHANLGEGEFGKEAVKRILRHKKLQEIPFILETPGLKKLPSAKEEVQRMRELAGVDEQV